MKRVCDTKHLRMSGIVSAPTLQYKQRAILDCRKLQRILGRVKRENGFRSIRNFRSQPYLNAAGAFMLHRASLKPTGTPHRSVAAKM